MSARHPDVPSTSPGYGLLPALPSLLQIEARIDEIGARAGDPETDVLELVSLGEKVVEHWLLARGEAPTSEQKEGFRLLALHRQGAKGEPSFNACRETCRELAYHYNLIMLEPKNPDRKRRVRLAAMIAKHLCLFVSGKMQVAGLGEFCCSARPLRTGGA
jgi:hypothetical protein